MTVIDADKADRPDQPGAIGAPDFSDGQYRTLDNAVSRGIVAGEGSDEWHAMCELLQEMAATLPGRDKPHLRTFYDDWLRAHRHARRSRRTIDTKRALAFALLDSRAIVEDIAAVCSIHRRHVHMLRSLWRRTGWPSF